MDTVVSEDGSLKVMGCVGNESEIAYKDCPFSALSTDFLARFSRDPQVRPKPDEILVDSTWRIAVPRDLSPLGKRMANDLAEFLRKSMGTALVESVCPRTEVEAGPAKTIALLDKGGGAEKVAESFTITVKNNQIVVAGCDAAGLRNGVVQLVDQMGFRQAPIVPVGTQTHTPRITVQLGMVPRLGSAREAAFLGYNAVLLDFASLWAVSTSGAIPELTGRHSGDLLAKMIKQGQAAGEYGLKCYACLDTRQRFSEKDPVFQKYPDIRGAQVQGGQYILCTEHPLVKKYMAGSFQGLFRDIPQLAGVVIIIGGEGFYHCFMRTQTKCPRCEKLGAETVVADLCNNLADAIRKVNPSAEIIAWPYSAFLWSADGDQAQLIAKLKPGTAILTELEKNEYVSKPGGVNKLLWDYSIDMVGLGGRATRQLAACKKAGIPIYLKSEPEMSFEAPRLPHVPCLDRWLGRATAIAASGASGLFNISGAAKPTYGTSAAEVYKYACWNPAPEPEDILQQLAARIAGPEGGPHLRNAWKFSSESIDFSPEQPPYYIGPYYLGPAHPMCASPTAPLPEVFWGRFSFFGDGDAVQGLALHPICLTSPRGDVPVFGKMYREMEKRLKLAVDEVKTADRCVPERCRLMFRAEVYSILWFYATARAHANFYEACQLRDQFLSLAQNGPNVIEKRKLIYDRWMEVLKDERQNAAEALPLAEADMRLDCYYAGDHRFNHMADMVLAKLRLIDDEINKYLPHLLVQPQNGRQIDAAELCRQEEDKKWAVCRATLPQVRVRSSPKGAAGDPLKVAWDKTATGGEWRTILGCSTSRKVDARFAQDGDYLYIRLTEEVNSESLTNDQGIWGGDDWELFFAPKQGTKPYRQIGVNPKGGHIELAYGESSAKWKSGVKVISETGTNFWKVSMSFPLGQLLPGGVNLGQSVYANIFRVGGVFVEDTPAWSPIFETSLHALSRLGEIILEEECN